MKLHAFSMIIYIYIYICDNCCIVLVTESNKAPIRVSILRQTLWKSLGSRLHQASESTLPQLCMTLARLFSFKQLHCVNQSSITSIMAELSQGWIDAGCKRTLTYGSHFSVLTTLPSLQQDVKNLSFYKYFNAPDAKFPNHIQ